MPPVAFEEQSRPPRVFLACKIAILIFAFGVTWYAGHRGVFLMDQSTIFDGGWRVLQGQVPYRDFYLAFGPLALWIQAGFFRIFSVNFSSMVVAAAIVNVIAAASVMRMAHLLWRGVTYWTLIPGWITAIWFQPPYGTLSVEQVAFLFNVLALQCLLESGDLGNLRSSLFTVLAGGSATLACLSKQDAGAFFFPVCIGVIVSQSLVSIRRLVGKLFLFAAGATDIAYLFYLWLERDSAPQMFWRHAVEVAAEIGSQRIQGHVLTVLENLFFCLITPRSAISPSLLGMLIGPVLLIIGTLNRRLGLRRLRAMSVAGFLLLALPLYQNGVMALTSIKPQNAEPFIGLILFLLIFVSLSLLRFAYSIGLPLSDNVLSLRIPSRRFVGFATGAVLAVMIGWVTAEGIHIARFGIVRGFNHNTRFISRLNVPGMKLVYWGEPTEIPATNDPVIIRKEDFEALVRYLESRSGNFFVAGDATMLYGLLRRPSPQPLLYYQPERSFSARDIPALDQKILRALQAHNVQTVVREKFVLGTQPAFGVFPQTWSWLNREFQPARKFGIFEVWERRSGGA